MPRRDGLDIDAWITVHRRHPISCDVHCDEAQFKLGPNGGALVLCFTWTALAKFLRVAHKVANLSNEHLQPGPPVYQVYADELSYQIHHPGSPHADEKKVILGAGSAKKDR